MLGVFHHSLSAAPPLRSTPKVAIPRAISISSVRNSLSPQSWLTLASPGGGRVWVPPDADLWVDRVGEAPEALYEMGLITQTKVERAEIGLRGRSPGDFADISASPAVPLGLPGQGPISGHGFVLDRLRAAVHWKDEDGLLWAEAIVRSSNFMGREFDWQSVEQRLEDVAEHNALRSLMSRTGITNESNGERVDGPNA